jgi:hypothetical protein
LQSAGNNAIFGARGLKMRAADVPANNRFHYLQYKRIA